MSPSSISARRGIAESVEEDGLEAYATFEENALAKARYFSPRIGDAPPLPTTPGLAVRRAGRRVRECTASGGVVAPIWLVSRSMRREQSTAARFVERRRGSERVIVCAAAYGRRFARESFAAVRCDGQIVDDARAARMDSATIRILFRASWDATFGEASVEEKER